jgi:glycosyltransferase involved in cell wall biosynthesis
LRILFLSNWYPYPPNNGSKIRIFNLINQLARQHEVTLVSFIDPASRQFESQIEVPCNRIYTIPKKEYNPSSLKAIMGLFNRKPRVLVDRYVPEMENRIQDEIIHGKHDLIIASQIYMAAYLDKPRNIPAIFEEVEVGVFDGELSCSTNIFGKVRHQLTLLKMATYYRNLFAHFAACTVVSEEERMMVNRLVPGSNLIEVIPNGVELAVYRGFHSNPNPNQLIFTGSFAYRPNYEAMEWFIKSVFPKIWSQVPEVQLTITGDNSNYRLPDTNRINLTGYVDDIRPLMASSWLSLVPIFTGGGTRLKILEAFALKTPVVATRKGCEGLEVMNDIHLLIADTPDDFAEQTIRLLKDWELRESLVSNAYQLVEEKYDWAVIMPYFDNLMKRVTNCSTN